jgi:hypothetical protein
LVYKSASLAIYFYVDDDMISFLILKHFWKGIEIWKKKKIYNNKKQIGGKRISNSMLPNMNNNQKEKKNKNENENVYMNK